MVGVRWAFRCGSWTPTRSEWLLAARCVQREEKERIGQFMFAKDAKSAMAGRLLLRRLVCDRMGVPWADIRLERSPRGKPYLANPACSSPESVGWSFNISHQGDYAVLAAEQGLQVGVDVMKTTMPGSSSVPEFFRIMTRQFTDYEWSVIRRAGSEWEQLTMFYRHWVLKESFIKAIGTGLAFNLQRAEFHLSPEPIADGKVCRRTTMHLDEEEEEVWTFEETVLGKDHHVAVALRPRHTVRSVPAPPPAITYPPPSFTFLSFSDLISMATPLFEEDSAYWENFQKKAEAPERQRLTATV
ncbi:L-aminoadipate-semialdehyde dehydrogenase-phosphopantetheinyl transferase isoform X2 [Salmo salar]|uniref:L-aminoadipate-semialdehyde dehydrogenase-phosphopantetheinyl transferase n=1 Tax=Salmo salar TaxID=8030 RepID=A0A1S3T244_SALSA|nr:L-aminoadipate-semialdehyde dehydrogenase-phosphopantetheinyl transferase isoform X2 [Salmo salar]|eukprot:XP_014070663.1 PREDICTED: L-aminoadipate-semialdehyde dehydrogenase-phosphopantetheinyl transferase isoform X2 [Salmo salar]